MSVELDMVESGPADAERTVLMLPGGMCSAESWAEVMAQPALEGIHVVAVTLPGHAGAPAPGDFSIEAYAALTSDLAARVGADVVVGFSLGATVAQEMVLSGGFTGPVVLLGISLSPEDEPGFFRAIIRLGSVLGPVPAAILKLGAASMVKRIPVPPERLEELRADFRRNRSGDLRRGLREYLRYLGRDADPAQRLCAATSPIWVVHAEKGDGGLTAHERSTLEAGSQVEVVTIPGQVFFLPNEVPELVAATIVDAVAAA